MEEASNLISDLEELNTEYGNLNPKDSKEVDDTKVIASGQLVINFYENTFRPKYAGKEGEVFEFANTRLRTLSNLAAWCIREGKYQGLRVLLIKGESDLSNPNLLEEIIEKAKKEV